MPETSDHPTCSESNCGLKNKNIKYKKPNMIKNVVNLNCTRKVFPRSRDFKLMPLLEPGGYPNKIYKRANPLQ